MAQPIKIKASKRSDLVVEYDGENYTLTGRIPSEVMTASSDVPHKGLTLAQRNSEIGIRTIDAFVSYVLPADFRAALDMRDITQVFEAWRDHVDLGGSNASAS